MKQNFDQLDKFHEDISKWSLQTDILAAVDLPLDKNVFYTSDEYMFLQRQLLYQDLKLQAQKTAQKILAQSQQIDTTERPQYILRNCQMVKKFLILELSSLPKPGIPEP